MAGLRGCNAPQRLPAFYPGEGVFVKVDLKQVEEACKELYIRALKMLPPDIKAESERWAKIIKERNLQVK